MLDILVIDGRDERFSFLGLDGIITVSCCPNCVTLCEGISTKFNLDGTSEVLDYEGEEENYFSEDIIDEMVNNKFVVSMKEKPLFYHLLLIKFVDEKLLQFYNLDKSLYIEFPLLNPL